MGTRVFLLTQLTALQDHPHAYGDKSKGFCTFKQALGSSPRVWGQAALHFCAYQNHGIIPTRMGTRKVSLQYVNTIRDHPHAYGDKEFLGHIKLIDSGSSPRVWGQVIPQDFRFVKGGIIPTRMGTSS